MVTGWLSMVDDIVKDSNRTLTNKGKDSNKKMDK